MHIDTEGGCSVSVDADDAKEEDRKCVSANRKEDAGTKELYFFGSFDSIRKLCRLVLQRCDEKEDLYKLGLWPSNAQLVAMADRTLARINREAKEKEGVQS